MGHRMITLVLMVSCCAGYPTNPQTGAAADKSPAGPARAAGRVLGLCVNTAGDGDFDAAFRTARSAGMRAISLVLNWDDTEKALGEFASPWPRAANASYGGNKMPVSLRLATFDTNNNRFPPDLRGKTLDEPQVIARFNAFADWVLEQMPDVELTDLSIGNEVNASLGIDAEKWRQYTAFFKATRAHIRAKRAGLQVGSNIMFSAYTGQAQKHVAELNRLADVVMVSYYPLDHASHVRSPTVVKGGFARICAAYPGREVHFTELGYPSGEGCSSSLEKQRQFVEEVFAAWDTHAEQVKMVMFVWLHDISPKSVERYRTYYGISDRAFLSYLGSLGLRTYAGSGTDKPGFAALRAQVKARGW